MSRQRKRGLLKANEGFACVIVSVCLCANLLLTPSTLRAEAIPIQWSDLPDADANKFDDPFRALEFKDLEILAKIANLKDQLELLESDDVAREPVEKKLKFAMQEAGQRSLDAEALLAQRWVIAEKRRGAQTAINPDVLGFEVRLVGFAFPGSEDMSGRQTAYLVETYGMCSHVPPPPPNRILRLILPEGIEIGGTYIPVAVVGRLTAEDNTSHVFVVDGLKRLHSSVVMDVAIFEYVQNQPRGIGDVRTRGPVRPHFRALEAKRASQNRIQGRNETK